MDTTTPAAAQPTVHFWLITLQVPADNGYGVLSTEGTIPIAPGGSRAHAYRKIRAALTKQNPDLERADVLFFSLEPDQL